MTEPLVGLSGVRIWPNGPGAAEAPVNALGEPSPGRTDFARWSRGSLERFAREAADENLVLRTQVAQLREDVATALAAWRACAVNTAGVRGTLPTSEKGSA